MKKTSLANHIKELQSHSIIDSEELKEYLKKFKDSGNVGINSNLIFYLLNLNTMHYEYINNACLSFTGLHPQDFYKLGMNVLSKIIIREDLKLLSESIFPKMNNFTKKLSSEEKSKIVFEVYYKMKNVNTGEKIQIVEFSSYCKYDNNGNPILSSGVCCESSKVIKGVRGIVRIREADNQRVLFDESLSNLTNQLTKTENGISKLLIKGFSRKEISIHNSISIHTVNTHIKNIYKKLGINKVSELNN